MGPIDLETKPQVDRLLLVLFVNDSEYNQSTGAKPILSPGYIYLVYPSALRAPTPPRPLLWGGGSTKKRKSPVASGMAFGHVCVGVGVVLMPKNNSDLGWGLI